MNRLFVRAFLAVWGASALIGGAIAVAEALRDARAPTSAEDRLLREAVAAEGAALLALEAPARASRREAFRARTGVALFVVDDARLARGELGDVPASVAAAARASGSRDRWIDEGDRRLLAARVDGGAVVARIPRRPRWSRALATDSFALRAAIVIAVSALIAFALARWLTRPIDRLRAVTRRIAEGELSARATPEVGGAAAELAALAEDFDAMTARLEALVGARDRLLADVSHELGSPLARQRVALALARRTLGEAEILDTIEREAERLGALVDEILTLRRLETEGPLAPGPVSLDALVGDVAGDAAFEARERGVTVEAKVAPLVVEGDAELLRRALDNVVRNAIRHAPPGTTVEVALARDGEGARVEVRDRGPGVPADQLARIFEPLVRLDGARAESGAGLGLAIARRAVVAHGGSIEAAPRDGGGLVVRVALPRVFTNLHTT